MTHRIITKDVGTWRVPDNVWNKLPELDIEAIRECLEAFTTVQHPLRCEFCNKNDYYLEHDKDCPVTKAKAILESLEGVK